MSSHLLTRFISLTLTLLAATAVIFAVVNILPGDPAAYMMGIEADPAATAALRAELGLNGPLLTRYIHWLLGLLRGDFGVSYTYRVPVAELIAERLQISLPLALLALLLSCAIALPLGLLSAARRGRGADIAIIGATQIGLAIPNFWFALLLVYIFSTSLHWVSSGGFPGWETGLPAVGALILPAIALALPQAAILTRVTRAALINTLHEDYVRTARAKGLSEGQALRRHAFRNALIPVLTLIGLQFSFLLAGAIIVENVFYLPGLGRLVFQAILQRDLIVVEGVIVLLVFAVVVITFLVDILHALADPRLSERRSA